MSVYIYHLYIFWHENLGVSGKNIDDFLPTTSIVGLTSVNFVVLDIVKNPGMFHLWTSQI